MNQENITKIEGYQRVDGRNAYQSTVKKMTLGTPTLAENQSMQIAAQIWKENTEGELEVSMELPIHQIMDLMIFVSRTLLHFREAYRLPLMYDPEKPTLERIGIQGDVLQVDICTENPNLPANIQAFAEAVNDLGELTGERLRVLARILAEMEYCSA